MGTDPERLRIQGQFVTRLAPLMALRSFAHRDWIDMVERAVPPPNPFDLAFAKVNEAEPRLLSIQIGCVLSEYTSIEDMRERINCRCERRGTPERLG